jgi:hypothetical protein
MPRIRQKHADILLQEPSLEDLTNAAARSELGRLLSAYPTPPYHVISARWYHLKALHLGLEKNPMLPIIRECVREKWHVELDNRQSVLRLRDWLCVELNVSADEADQIKLSQVAKLLKDGKRIKAGGKQKKLNRGRPFDTDRKQDKRIWDAWQTRQYAKYADLARNLGMPEREVEKAIDRERKRRNTAPE